MAKRKASAHTVPLNNMLKNKSDLCFLHFRLYWQTDVFNHPLILFNFISFVLAQNLIRFCFSFSICRIHPFIYCWDCCLFFFRIGFACCLTTASPNFIPISAFGSIEPLFFHMMIDIV